MKTKIISMLVVIMLLFTNFVYAIEMPMNEFKNNVEELFLKKLVITSESGVTTNSGVEKVEITDTLIKVISEGQEIDINYSVEGNTLNIDSQFQINLKYQENGELSDESSLEFLGIMMILSNCIDRVYLAAAKAMGIDMSVAISYANEINSSVQPQEIETETGMKTIVESSLAKSEAEINLKTGVYAIKQSINIDELSKITEQSLLNGVKYNVAFVENNSTEQPENPTQPEMPKTGIAYETVYVLIAIIAICIVVGYKVYKK